MLKTTHERICDICGITYNEPNPTSSGNMNLLDPKVVHFSSLPIIRHSIDKADKETVYPVFEQIDICPTCFCKAVRLHQVDNIKTGKTSYYIATDAQVQSKED